MSNGIDRLRRPSAALSLSLALALLGGCLSPEALERRLDESQPAALASAKDRARTDLSCEEPIATDVVSRSPGDSSAYSLSRVEYKIAASGCRKRILLTVACTKTRLCSALAQDAFVQEMPHK